MNIRTVSPPNLLRCQCAISLQALVRKTTILIVHRQAGCIPGICRPLRAVAPGNYLNGQCGRFPSAPRKNSSCLSATTIMSHRRRSPVPFQKGPYTNFFVIMGHPVEAAGAAFGRKVEQARWTCQLRFGSRSRDETVRPVDSCVG